MSSQVRYRFKNAVAEDSVQFDGAVIQIGDVKRLIATKRGLGPDGAAELTLFDSSTGEEHGDDSRVIPRNTLVLVKRAPAAKFKPLSSAAGGATAAAPQQQQQAAAAPPANGAGAADDFGGDYYSDRPQPALVQEEEDKALASRLQGTAASWMREVRQGAMRGRGRGRGRGDGAPYDYRCPRCAHMAGWVGGWLCACSLLSPPPSPLLPTISHPCPLPPSSPAGATRWASTGCKSAPPRATPRLTASASARPWASP